MLVMAIFVLVVLAVLGMAMVQISSDSSRSMVYEVYGARAFNAANSGAEKALNEIFGPGGTEHCLALDSYDMPDIVEFHGCAIEVTCATPFVIDDFIYFKITSKASCQSNEFSTQRAVVVEAKTRS